MMTNMKTLYAQTGATAIAAILALSSTQLSAQEAPTTTEPAPATVTTPAPVPETTPIIADPLAPDPVTTPATPTPKAKATAKRAAPVKKTAAGPRPTVTRAPAKNSAAPPIDRAAPIVPVATALAPSNTRPEVTTTPISPLAQTNADNLDIMMEIGGGALALLLLGGGTTLVLRRRRRREEEEELAWADETYEPEPAAPEPRHDPIFEQRPAVYAPSGSAFGWGNAKPPAQTADDGSDRRPGETWVERAYRGPSPANPSVSIRVRLKRAVFFDKREREVAAGTAVAVEPGAGLPDNRDESAGTQEHQREVA
jgi:hypothetical protein